MSTPDKVVPTSIGRWAWSPAESDAWPHLAQFVVDRQELPLKARALAPYGADDLTRRQALGELWTQFADLRIPYQAPAWDAERGRQDIRDPDLVLDEGGTCLDLVLLFAAMALSAGLRPFLVVDPAHSKTSGGHAVVAVDLVQGPDEESNMGLVTRDRNPEDRQPSGWGYVSRGELRSHVELERLALLDCTHATADPHQGSRGEGARTSSEPRGVRDVGQAAGHAAPFLSWESTGSVAGWTTGDVAVVDVWGVLRAWGLGQHKVDKSRRPAITSSLPEAPPWVRYPSRERLLAELLPRLTLEGVAETTSGDTERRDDVKPERSAIIAKAGIVLFGPPGVGKSRLAHEVATRSGRNAAWWLTANDDRTLRRSLASASAKEAGRPLPETDLGRDEEADAGLARLAENRNPWLVVLDNANCDPSELKARPRPRVDRGQRLIVTTFPEYANAWAAVLGGKATPGDAGWVGFEVAPLADDDLREAGSTLSDSARAAAAGSALLVRAYETLSREHPVDFEAVLNAESGDGAVRLWNVFRHLEPDCVDAATLAAWLPPDGLPAALLGERANRLVEVGLLTRSLTRPSSEPLFDLHRTIGAAARATDSQPVEHALAILDDAARRAHLDRFGDSATLDQVATVLVDAHRRRSAQASLGSVLVRLAALLEAFGRVVEKEKGRPDQGWSAEGLLLEAQHREDLTPMERADCLHGLARAVNQDSSRNGPKVALRGVVETAEQTAAREQENRRRLGLVERALEMVERARELRSGDRLLVARTEALRGLLMQKRARFLAHGERLDLLTEAYDLLRWSHREREVIIHEQRRAAGVPEDELDEDPELARAIFNLAGSANGLAVTLPEDDQEGRRRYLNDAEAVYERVQVLRTKIYGSARPHPHILSCTRGLGLINYQRSWLLTSSVEEKLSQLRTATLDLAQTLADDEKLDYEDGTDAIKTLALLQKVAEMRLQLSAKGNPDATHSEGGGERSKMRSDKGPAPAG